MPSFDQAFSRQHFTCRQEESLTTIWERRCFSYQGWLRSLCCFKRVFQSKGKTKKYRWNLSTDYCFFNSSAVCERERWKTIQNGKNYSGFWDRAEYRWICYKHLSHSSGPQKAGKSEKCSPHLYPSLASWNKQLICSFVLGWNLLRSRTCKISIRVHWGSNSS